MWKGGHHFLQLNYAPVVVDEVLVLVLVVVVVVLVVVLVEVEVVELELNVVVEDV